MWVSGYSKCDSVSVRVRVLFDFSGGHSRFLPQDPGVNESDPSALGIRELSPVVVPPVVQIKEAPLDCRRLLIRAGYLSVSIISKVNLW
ncbi:hypothetical protein ACET3Z_012803 [Daucus carota]